MPTAREIKEVAHRRALIKAVGSILKQGSYARLAINAVAEEAKVDKTFIYRKYGDFSGLLHTYVEKRDYWLNDLEEISEETIDDHRAFMKKVLKGLLDQLYNNEELQQFLVWELGDKEAYTSKISITRELLVEKLLSQTRLVLDDEGINLNTIYALFMAGINYLVIHKDKSTFCTLDLAQENGYKELISTMDWLVDVIFDRVETKTEVEKIAIRAYEKGMDIKEVAELTGLPEHRVQKLIVEN